MDYTVHGILQARILEWVAYPFPGDPPDPRIELGSPALQADSLPTELEGSPYYPYDHISLSVLLMFFVARITMKHEVCDSNINMNLYMEESLIIQDSIVLNIFCK